MRTLHALPATAPKACPTQFVSRILIAEDSLTARLLLRHYLQILFPMAAIEEAGDGKEAMRALGTAKMDLIVTDLQMPELDGEGFIRLLRHSNLLKNKPVVITTVAPDQVNAELAKDPCVRVLAKPVREDDLRWAIAELVA